MTLTFSNSYADANNSQNYTFTSVAFGTASSDRWIIVAATTSAGSANVISSMTIGGVAASIFQCVTTSGSDPRLAIGAVKLTTGTSGNVVVNSDALNGRAGIGVYIWTGNDLTLYDSDKASGSGVNPSASLTIDIAEGGFLIANAQTSNVANSTPVWVGVTGDYAQVTETNAKQYGGSASSLSVQTGRTVSLSLTSASMSLGLGAYSFALISGPTNIKTFDGVTQSTGIKTYDGVTLANTKSVIGIT